jgi:hypothetical protein
MDKILVALYAKVEQLFVVADDTANGNIILHAPLVGIENHLRRIKIMWCIPL